MFSRQLHKFLAPLYFMFGTALILTDIPVDEIKRELEILGFQPLSYAVSEPLKNQRPMLVHIAADHKARHFSFKQPIYISISVEPIKSSGPPQCFSCRRFGHGSRNCEHLPRCVKCAGDHTAKECKKTRDESPTCSTAAVHIPPTSVDVHTSLHKNHS